MFYAQSTSTVVSERQSIEGWTGQHASPAFRVTVSTVFRETSSHLRDFDSTLPSFLSAALCTYQAPRVLRSSGEKPLNIPKRNLKSLAECFFRFVSPSVCSSLSVSLQNSPHSVLSPNPIQDFHSCRFDCLFRKRRFLHVLQDDLK